MAKQARENRVPIMMSVDELTEIDNWRFARHIATRSDAIRRAARNGLWVENDVADIAERTEVLYEETYEKYFEVRSWVSWFTDPGVPDDDKPPLSPLEVLERVAWWLQGILDDVERLDIQALALNNRLVGTAVAPHDRASKLARRRALAEAEKRREEYAERVREFEDQVASHWVFENMTEAEKDHILYVMPEEEADAELERRKALAPKIDPFEKGRLPETIWERNRKAHSARLVDQFRKLTADDAKRALDDYEGEDKQ